MAEFVERHLEDLLPVFENVSELQLFAKDELSRCVAKIRQFEYRLQRVVKRKNHLMAYVQYLLCLENLIEKRRIVNNNFVDKDVVQKTINQKIGYLYELGHKRYPADESLWLEHIEFCKLKGLDRTVSKLYQRMLSLLPNRQHLWAAAENWEIEDQGNLVDGEQLQQKALRLFRRSTDRWTKYLRTQLLIVQQKLERLQVLKGSTDLQPDDMPRRLRPAMTVFSYAIRAVDDGRQLCLRFLEESRKFAFAESFTAHVEHYMNEHFHDDPVQMDYFVRKQYGQQMSDELVFYDDSENVDSRFSNACDQYLAALRSSGNLAYREYYIRFLRTIFRSGQKDAATFRASYARLVFAHRFLFRQGGVVDENFFINWANLFPTPSMKIVVLQTAVKQLPEAVSLRLLLMTTLLRSGVDEAQLTANFNFASLPLSLPLWKKIANYVVKSSPSRMDELLQASLTTNLAIANCVKQVYVSQAFSDRGRIFQRLIKLSPSNLSFYKAYIAMELSQLPIDTHNVRVAYERAVCEYGKAEVNIWLDYYNFEAKLGDSLRCPQIYQRAIITLPSALSQSFAETFQLRQMENR